MARLGAIEAPGACRNAGHPGTSVGAAHAQVRSAGVGLRGSHPSGLAPRLALMLIASGWEIFFLNVSLALVITWLLGHKVPVATGGATFTKSSYSEAPSRI